jgi:hypothetical protein
MVCIGCFRKLKGPDFEPVRITELGPGERWTPCALCRGPCDAVPGIFYRLWISPPEPRGDVHEFIENVPPTRTFDPSLKHTRKVAKE